MEAGTEAAADSEADVEPHEGAEVTVEVEEVRATSKTYARTI